MTSGTVSYTHFVRWPSRTFWRHTSTRIPTQVIDVVWTTTSTMLKPRARQHLVKVLVWLDKFAKYSFLTDPAQSTYSVRFVGNVTIHQEFCLKSFRLRCLAERAVARLIDQARAALDFYVSRATSGWHSELLARSWEGLCGLTGFRRQLRKGIRSNFHGSTQLRPEAGATTRNTSVTEPPRTEIPPNPQ